MRGVEAAPLAYVLAAISVVIALSILVMMGTTIKGGVKEATETINESIVEGVRRASQELSETFGEEDQIVIDSVNKTNKTIYFSVFNWRNAEKFDVVIKDKSGTEEKKDLQIVDYCESKDLDGDGKVDDLNCKYKSDLEKMTSGILEIYLKSSDGKVLSQQKYIYK